MEHRNGIMEDLGAIMGFEATNRLIAVFGGASLYIPCSIEPGHPIALTVGLTPAQRLVAELGGEIVDLPDNAVFLRLRRMRRVAGLLAAGFAIEDAAEFVGVSTRTAARYRNQARALGLSRRKPTADSEA